LLKDFNWLPALWADRKELAMAKDTFDPIEKRCFVNNLARELLVKGYQSTRDSDCQDDQACNALDTAKALWDAINEQEPKEQ
jgi:hypothetical protein